VLGTAAFAVAAPGTMIAVVPWLLTGWQSTHPSAGWVGAGALLVVVGAAIGIQATRQFIVKGSGTPAPNAPPDVLVVSGLYRYVRNPMYIAVIAAIVGEALILGRPILFLWAGGFWLITATWVRLYEEPTLAKRFGDQYAAYRRCVPRWRPRSTPWPVGPADR
jgi:protein-S-isoprenylcysteine O-methyltransferase Ste14